MKACWIFLFPEYVKYCVYQLEVGAEGTEHFQGYMELSGKHSFKKLHLIPGLERAHFETRRGTAAQAITYCTKLDTRVSGPYHVGEPKNKVSVCACSHFRALFTALIYRQAERFAGCASQDSARCFAEASA